jgi:hypothetical protein
MEVEDGRWNKQRRIKGRVKLEGKEEENEERWDDHSQTNVSVPGAK